MNLSVRGAGLLAFVVLVAGVWGCSSSTRGPRGGRNVITAEEVRNASVNTAYELVEHLRPLWLRSRGGRSTRLGTEIVVYLNGSMYGDIDSLKGIPIEIVDSLQALDAAEAGRLPGLGSRHVERAILVLTRAGFDLNT